MKKLIFGLLVFLVGSYGWSQEEFELETTNWYGCPDTLIMFGTNYTYTTAHDKVQVEVMSLSTVQVLIEISGLKFDEQTNRKIQTEIMKRVQSVLKKYNL